MFFYAYLAFELVCCCCCFFLFLFISNYLFILFIMSVGRSEFSLIGKFHQPCPNMWLELKIELKISKLCHSLNTSFSKSTLALRKKQQKQIIILTTLIEIDTKNSLWLLVHLTPIEVTIFSIGYTKFICEIYHRRILRFEIHMDR